MKKIVSPPYRINEGIEDKGLFKNNKKRSFCIKDTNKYGPDYCKRAIRSYSHLSFAMRPEFVPKPKPKKKSSKPRAKKSNKVKNMFACMTGKEKKEMLKLLQNG